MLRIMEGDDNMYAMILRLYDAGKLTEEGVLRAVTIGWITENQANQILLAKNN